jgi:hypothetical protein
MTRQSTLSHEFVDYIPDVLEEGKVYVSVQFATVVHKCCCGCGREVVTPLSPTDWKLIFDGRTISLDPSIGNWSFPCQSHYWVRENRIVWSRRWSREEIEAGRARDRRRKAAYDADAGGPDDTLAQDDEAVSSSHGEDLWARFINWMRKRKPTRS